MVQRLGATKQVATISSSEAALYIQGCAHHRSILELESIDLRRMSVMESLKSRYNCPSTTNRESPIQRLFMGNRAQARLVDTCEMGL